LATASHLGRRSSVVVLAVTATAVALLALLIAQTSRQLGDAALLSAVGRQRILSERMLSAVTAARLADGPEKGVWQRRARGAAAQWRESSDRLRGVRPGGPALTPDLLASDAMRRASVLETDILAAAEPAMAEGASNAAGDSVATLQRRYLLAMEEVVAAVEQRFEHHVDGLAQLQAVCAILVLAALGLAVRLGLHPTEERLAATVSALAESESRTRAMLDAMSEGMLLSDDTGRVLASNPSAQQTLGFSAGDTMTLADFADRLVDAHGRLLPTDELPSRKTIRTGRPVTDAIVGVRANGQVARWLLVNTHPLFRGSTDTPHAAVAIFRDVSDARQLEEERAAQAEALALQNQELLAQADALEHGQALFRSLVDTAGNAIVGLDLEGRVFEWNREAEALFGVSRAAAIGTDYALDFIPDVHRDRMRGGIAAVLGGEALRNHTGPVRGANGERRTVIWNITPLRAGSDGPVHGLIAAGIDITEREASDERFRVLFERSSDAHLLLDDTGVIDCNDATLRLLQYDSKASLLGRTAADISPRRQPDGRLSLVVGAQMRQMARDRGYHRFEWVHQRSDGGVFPVEVTLTPVRLNGREVILSVWHDIAERKAVEAALRAAKDAAESANRTKSEFMTRMNHELRTPLTAIIGFSRVLLQGKQGVLSEGAQRYADRIRANGMHLLSLINQILDVAKVEAGRMELEPERIAVGDVVREMIQMLESTAEMKGIALRSEVPSTLATVVTDAAKLRQILINLVGNAIKFTDAGEVCIEVEADPRTTRPMSITIRDTGIGIPLDRQQKVFEPFEQGESSTRRQFGGTGLGLSIVKAFAELIGAAIEVESTVGVGTAFTIWLAPTDLPLPPRD
jgi:PAS domain S-box-containing protein